MKTLNLDTLSPEAAEAIKTVLTTLTAHDEAVEVVEGEQYLYTVIKADESEAEDGIRRGNYQPRQRPSDVMREIRDSVNLRDEPASVEDNG